MEWNTRYGCLRYMLLRSVTSLMRLTSVSTRLATAVIFDHTLLAELDENEVNIHVLNRGAMAVRSPLDQVR